MKKFSKILSVALIIALVMSFGVMAFAEGEEGGETPAATTKTITLTGGKAGHTYTLYQIFTGTVATVDNVEQLTDIQWGSDAPDAYKAQYDTAAAAAKAVATQNDARAFAQSLTLTGGTSQTLTADGTVTFSGLAEGYYIVTDANNNTAAVEGDYSSAVIVAVVKDVNGAMKGSGATSEKKVDDKNDSNNSEDATTWQDSADYDIGDAVPFQLKATTADNVAAYRKYHVTFQDKQSTGLDVPTQFTVSVLGKTLTLSNTVGQSATESTTNTKITAEVVTADDGQTFAIKVTFEPVGEDVTYLNNECNSTDILVNYTSVLNASAVVGAEGNPNTSYIKYSNNPESTDDKDEGKTPDDTVIVFTYKTVIDKIDETGAALKGADFTLYKQVADSTVTGAVKGSDITFADGVEHTAIKADAYYVVVGQKTGDATGSTFQFNGIDDGIYVIVETTVPTGYNAFKSAEFTVTATHDTENAAPKLLTLTGTAPFTNANATSGNVEVEKKDGTKHNEVSGELYTEIENNSGTQLPSTGGIGTTIFYVVGGVLVLAAIILLVTKKRMSE